MFCNPRLDAAAAAATPTLRRSDERRKIMNDEQDVQPLKQDTKGAYEPPKVIRVSLRPEEAVLGHCKVTGAAGPVATSCRSFLGACRTPGS
jgi:hypothetical protein